MRIQIKQTRYEPVPTGEYRAVITSITEEVGQYGPQLKFGFEIQAPHEYSGRTLLGWASAKFSPKSKLYAWTKAVLGGGDIPPDMVFDSNMILNRPVMLDVTVGENDRGQYNRIHGLRACTDTPQAEPSALDTNALSGEGSKVQEVIPF